MKQALALTFIVLSLAACGGDDGLGGVDDPPSNNSNNNNSMSTTQNGRNPTSTTMSASCTSCANTLSTESQRCSTTLDNCANNPANETSDYITCFRAEGRCQDEVLNQAADCHRNCGDTEQANVETCAGDCFLARATCAENTLLEADRCLDRCTDIDCDLCTATGIRKFDQCSEDAQSCADTCVRTHRGQ